MEGVVADFLYSGSPCDILHALEAVEERVGYLGHRRAQLDFRHVLTVACAARTGGEEHVGIAAACIGTAKRLAVEIVDSGQFGLVAAGYLLA